MVFGKNFVWLHFPKCAGHAVEQALRSIANKGEIEFDPRADPEGWHESVADRSARTGRTDLTERQVVCGFRRLPLWMLSRVHYDASRPPYLCATRDMICRGEFFEADGRVRTADDYVRYFGSSRVDRWLRTEHLSADFERHFAELLGRPLAGAALRRLRKIINGTQLNYVRAVGFHFTARELASLYAANPLWAAVERELYGDILRLPDEMARCAYVLDHRMRFVVATPAALEIWGKSADQVIGKTTVEVFPLSKGSAPHEAHLGALQSREPRTFATQSPTLGVPVYIDIQPTRAGLQVSFELLART